MRVLIVGSNPSTKNTDPNVPFKGTRSEQILNSWIEFLKISNYTVVNIFNQTTENNRPLTKREIKYAVIDFKERIRHIEYDKVIALGNSASAALTLLKISHWKIAHPSPRNRLLNDKNKLQESLERCKIYLYEN